MEILPNEEWYTAQSQNQRRPHHCPAASITGCPRYFASMDLAQRTAILSGEIPVQIRNHLLEKWKCSEAFVVDDHFVSVSFNAKGTFSGISNFCPEVSGRTFDLYCSDFKVHPDDPKHYSLLHPKHYTKCIEYSLLGYEEKVLMPADRGITPEKRFAVFQRDNFKCVYCGRSAQDALLHVDHKVSRSDRGGDEISNLVTACSLCNNGKGSASVI